MRATSLLVRWLEEADLTDLVEAYPTVDDALASLRPSLGSTASTA
ncbi:MAG TPA: hypothetical protein VIY28_08540 [Pseudonocardiaceae bacterium]